MGSVPVATFERTSARASAMMIVPLLALALFINYVDRGNLATASPLIKDELKLSNTELGFLTSAFFWTYTPAQLLIGWLIERFGATVVLAASVATWSAATAFTGLSSGFAMLMLLRLMLGLGESAAIPCTSKLLANYLPAEKLGLANGVVGAGIALGPAFGTLAGGLIMVELGWRASFLLFGVASLLWLWPWLAVTREARATAPRSTADETPSYFSIVSERAAWGTMLGHFSANYTLYFVLSWLPLYLVKEHGYSLVQMAQLGAFVYLVYAVTSAAFGWISDRLIDTGFGVNGVRKSVIVAGHLGAALCLLASAAGDSRMAFAGLVGSGAFFGLTGCSVFAIAQTIAGPRAAGKWVALQNCVANTAGIIAPLITGFIVDKTGQFTLAFAVASAIAVAGAAGWGLVVPRVAPIAWPSRGAT
jgi:MFS family permease